MGNFRIPRQTDRALLEALRAIQADMKPLGLSLTIRVRTFDGVGAEEVQVPEIDQEQSSIVTEILAEESEIFPQLWL